LSLKGSFFFTGGPGINTTVTTTQLRLLHLYLTVRRRLITATT
jgi:hypothetical protein